MWARRVSTVIMVMVLGLALACSRPATEANPPKLKIAGAGATFPYPLYKVWLQDYNKAHKELDISYDPVGSGEGIQRFLKQEVDFGASDAAMSDEEMAKVDRQVKLIPATVGIEVLAYNLKGLNGTLKLPREVYVAIFAGDIRKWNDPRIKQANPGPEPAGPGYYSGGPGRWQRHHLCLHQSPERHQQRVAGPRPRGGQSRALAGPRHAGPLE